MISDPNTILIATATLGAVAGGILARVLLNKRIQQAYQRGRDEFFAKRSTVEKLASDLQRELEQTQAILQNREDEVTRLSQENGELTRRTVSAEQAAARATELSDLLNRKEIECQELTHKLATMRQRIADEGRGRSVRDTSHNSGELALAGNNQSLVDLSNRLEGLQEVITSILGARTLTANPASVEPRGEITDPDDHQPKTSQQTEAVITLMTVASTTP